MYVLVGDLGGRGFSDAHDPVSQRLVDGQMTTKPTRLVYDTQLPEEELHLGQDEVALRCDHDVRNVPGLAKRLQHELVPEAQRMRRQG